MTIAFAIILAAFLIIAILEIWRPARPFARQRWPLNLALGLGNGVMLRLAGVIGPLAAAHVAQSHDVGLLQLISLPHTLSMISVVVIMDCAIYWQHRAMHHVGLLWRFHKLHHADMDFDVTTGVRFHPIEALLSFIYKSVLVLLLGAPPESVMIFELWLTLGSLIEHGNIRLPLRLDRAMRRFWVTPAMHRVHHSAHRDDHNYNFSFALSFWDRLFGSYRAEASGTIIGLPQT